MAVGEARELSLSKGCQVLIGKSMEHPEQSPMFDNVPWLVPPQGVEPGTPVELLQNFRGHRPYLDHPNCTKDRVGFVESHRAIAGQLFFTTTEKLWAMGRLPPDSIVVEPHVKGTFSGSNKAWPWENWLRLVKMIHGPVVQISAPGLETLPGVIRAPETENVRLALAMLATARLVISSEGLMHHAAAALMLPAVALWGDRTDPLVVGYTTHENVVGVDAGQWCGARKPCQHCADSMASITPEHVAERVALALA